MPNFPELIVHIGAGKTGSTAIQFALRDNGPKLADQDMKYLGLMLEQIPAARANDWCVQGHPQLFFQSKTPEVTDDSVYLAARDGLRDMAARGLTRAVWSNEAFLVQNGRIIEILRRLAADGVSIRVIAYVRRHDKRARSAYVEFGIKSKRYPGDLRPFRDWVGNHSIAYADNLSLWNQAFPGALEVYNFDVLEDVGAHFCEVLGLQGLSSARPNESPSPTQLAAWAVYSGSRPKPTWANDFRRLEKPLRRDNKIHPRPVPELSALLPSTQDLEDVQQRFQGDFDAVNAMLTAQGQAPLEFGPIEADLREPTSWEMDRMLLQMVFSLQEQVLRLNRKVKALEAKADMD